MTRIYFCLQDCQKPFYVENYNVFFGAIRMRSIPTCAWSPTAIWGKMRPPTSGTGEPQAIPFSYPCKQPQSCPCEYSSACH